jgi:hypothetical protein
MEDGIDGTNIYVEDSLLTWLEGYPVLGMGMDKVRVDDAFHEDRATEAVDVGIVNCQNNKL